MPEHRVNECLDLRSISLERRPRGSLGVEGRDVVQLQRRLVRLLRCLFFSTVTLDGEPLSVYIFVRVVHNSIYPSTTRPITFTASNGVCVTAGFFRENLPLHSRYRPNTFLY